MILANVVISEQQNIVVGASANVYCGYVNTAPVAVKRLRIWQANKYTVHKKFLNEVLVMQFIQHPHILPLLGVIYRDYELGIISSWLQNGTVVEYLSKYPDTSRINLVSQITNGLMFLRRRGIVHGDLKGDNILISDDGTILIADFGLATFRLGSLRSSFHYRLSSSGVGTPRWMAPELLRPNDRDGSEGKPTFESDIFSFGMLVYEIYSGHIPFYEFNQMSAILNVILHKRPSRPQDVPDTIWQLIEDCWAHHPLRRPQITDIHLYIQDVMITEQLVCSGCQYS
ncbi:kinase-like domain-containing protein [Crucibulum laeve]|uniref:Kinase-like domain-containing protein n=1 Tax=Crucibulum laeve TaxID=68775 RepID=A0A5C3M0Y7_9AGAR|nr:kinase-like domain-containing protein [Crucibulum laeve]